MSSECRINSAPFYSYEHFNTDLELTKRGQRDICSVSKESKRIKFMKTIDNSVPFDITLYRKTDCILNDDSLVNDVECKPVSVSSDYGIGCKAYKKSK